MACAVARVSLADPPAFRVDTDIFVADNAKPAKQNITLFHGGVYYDFSVGDALTVMVVDPTQKRISLLDAQQQIKTAIDIEKLSKRLEEARQQAGQSELLKVLQAAEVKQEPSTGKITVGSSAFFYSATLQSPPDAQMAQQYAQFADWSAQLNSAYPPYQPPYLRLQLNEAIAEKGMLPSELIRTTNQNNQTSHLRSRLHPTWELNTDDHQKIASARKMLNEFKEVSAQEYFSAPKSLANRGAVTNKATGNKY